MKKLKKITLWSVLSVSLIIGGLILINPYPLSTTSIGIFMLDKWRDNVFGPNTVKFKMAERTFEVPAEWYKYHRYEDVGYLNIYNSWVSDISSSVRIYLPKTEEKVMKQRESISGFNPLNIETYESKRMKTALFGLEHYKLKKITTKTYTTKNEEIFIERNSNDKVKSLIKCKKYNANHTCGMNFHDDGLPYKLGFKYSSLKDWQEIKSKSIQFVDGLEVKK